MAELFLHDTMSRTKRRFVPRDPERVTMYVCGPTVYNYAHIGNARPVVVFDVLFRLLRRLYGEDAVVYARNITDVDDKINAKVADEAAAAGEDPFDPAVAEKHRAAITAKFADIYNADMAALGALPPTMQPRATDHIPEMVALIGRLLADGVAYAAEGHVLFDIGKFSDYGKLSGRSLDDMIAGARVEVAPYKRNAADFVLWKPSRDGEPAWEGPADPATGAPMPGRPGWHLECSAMIEAVLGPLPIDIHGGGHDLIFPHHENEIAQSVCGDHTPALADYWVHNGFLDMAGEKMSKSLGNVLLVHELVKQVPGEVLRWALLSGHYRQPLDWTGELVEQSRSTLDGLYQVLQDADSVVPRGYAGPPGATVAAGVEAILCDDLNTPRAFKALADHARDLRAALSQSRQAADDWKRTIDAYRQELLAGGALLGFLQADPEAWFQGGADEGLKAQVDALLAARAEARKAKDWPTADRIRGELAALNVEVMDGPEGATWRLKDAPAQ